MGHTVFWIGAGYSKPAHGFLASELLSGPARDAAGWSDERLEPFSRFAESLLQNGEHGSQGIERAFDLVWSRAQIGADFDLNGEEADAEGMLEMLQEYLATLTSGIRFQGASKMLERYGEHLRRIKTRSRSLTIVSTNYDLVVEQALESAGLNYCYGARTGVEFYDVGKRDFVSPDEFDAVILKLHGSCNWASCESCRQPVAIDRPYVRMKRLRCPSCQKGMMNLLLIPPLAVKESELAPIRCLVEEAKSRLERASELICVGYSLPVVDRVASYLMSRFGRSQGSTKSRVISGDDQTTRARFEGILRESSWEGRNYEDFLDRQVGSWGIR